MTVVTAQEQQGTTACRRDILAISLFFTRAPQDDDVTRQKDQSEQNTSSTGETEQRKPLHKPVGANSVPPRRERTHAHCVIYRRVRLWRKRARQCTRPTYEITCAPTSTLISKETAGGNTSCALFCTPSGTLSFELSFIRDCRLVDMFETAQN